MYGKEVIDGPVVVEPLIGKLLVVDGPIKEEATLLAEQEAFKDFSRLLLHKELLDIWHKNGKSELRLEIQQLVKKYRDWK